MLPGSGSPVCCSALSAERVAARHGVRAWQVLPAASKQRGAPQRECRLGSAGRRAGARLHTTRPRTSPQRLLACLSAGLACGKTAAPLLSAALLPGPAGRCCAAGACGRSAHCQRRGAAALTAHVAAPAKGCTCFRGGWLSSVDAAEQAVKHCLRLSGDAASAHAPVLSNQPGLHQPLCRGQ